MLLFLMKLLTFHKIQLYNEKETVFTFKLVNVKIVPYLDSGAYCTPECCCPHQSTQGHHTVAWERYRFGYGAAFRLRKARCNWSKGTRPPNCHQLEISEYSEKYYINIILTKL